MKEWYSISDLVALRHASLPGSEKSLRRTARDNHWDADKNRSREVAGGGGQRGVRKEYHYTLLPHFLQAELVTNAMIDEVTAQERDQRAELVSESLWHRFQTAPEGSRTEADKRLKLVQQIAKLRESKPDMVALTLVEISSKVPQRTLYRWLGEVRGLHKSDWLPRACLFRQRSRVHVEVDHRRRHEASLPLQDQRRGTARGADTARRRGS
ncbi:hypothetical protein [uncultured Tateyamaria sp.]|uniref:hypothetical protein n=1 Tax=uncultured Tateyamaria sp. TaxID=455651 RepID=UPI00260A9BA4|nr:hypothetical protein [uncultured Tateyamaria sp.]